MREQQNKDSAMNRQTPKKGRKFCEMIIGRKGRSDRDEQGPSLQAEGVGRVEK